MKKVLASLSVILLVAILGVAVVFAYGSYKDLDLKKEKTKLADKKHSTTDKQDNNNDNQTNLDQTDGNQEQTTSTNEQNIENSNDPNNIMKNDTNGDGVITRDEMTPELEKLEREGKFQVAVKGIDTNDDSNKESQPKYTAEDAKNMSDDEFLDAYKEGMSSDDAKAVDDLAKDPAYREYLRGQVEARENGQGRNY